jgi:predicted ATPase/transcriptional regulator with XRE-family HTH domain
VSTPAGAEFGEMVAELRRMLGLTQEALAERSGISVRTIRNLEGGRTGRPRSASVTLLADALDLTGSRRAAFEMKSRAMSLDPPLLVEFTAASAGPGRPATESHGAGVAGQSPSRDGAGGPPPPWHQWQQTSPGLWQRAPALIPERATDLPRTTGDRQYPAGSAAGQVNGASATTGASSSPHPLIESLVGRGSDVTQLLQLVPKTPLVVLTGPGGVGKTRLAIAVANQLAADYPGGVATIELGHLAAELSDLSPAHDEVAGAFLRGLGTGMPRSGSPAAVIDLLADRRMILVIDNAEHVAKATARLVGHLLTSCPGLRMIVTSRRPFGVPGERLWEVRPLPVSPAGPAQNPTSPAVELFMHRAMEQCPGLDLMGKLDLVTRLCHLLDGLPLAIEFAVGWLRSISAEVLAQRLSPGMLRAPVGAGLPHQQDLAKSVSWSVMLLTDRQRRLLSQLARFTGPFDLEAVEGLAGMREFAGVNVAAELATLVDNSLVQVTREGSYRYGMLRLIRACLTMCSNVDLAAK